MGIYLGQMPPAEMARLKAEIAETLLANFSYPRFYDYRTNTLRMRPVDRGKRQEVWTYLSSFDFNVFSRVDVASPDFQRQVERLLIQFVQRNRTFFGQQGRKRMPDVRALITSSSASITEGLRGHLSGRAKTPFGSARPVISWAKAGDAGRLELSWEQIASPTMLLQQQLQEARAETQPVPGSDGRAAVPPPVANGTPTNGASSTLSRRSPRMRATTQGMNNGNEAAAASKPPASPAASITEATKPPASSDQPVLHDKSEQDVPTQPITPGEKVVSFQERSFPAQMAGSPVPLAPAAPVNQPALAQPQESRQRELTRTEPLAPTMTGQKESGTLMVSDEDVVIFEEMRHQLLVWLRVEVVRAGVELTGQAPAELLEILGQQDGADETRLQIVSTLLGLVNQVIANGRATLVEYKQAMMFHLIHTRRSR